MHQAQKICVTCGVYRSGSTWVSNVAAAIFATTGPVRLITADSFMDLFQTAAFSHENLVVKTHKPDASLRLFMRLAARPVVVTVRDPGDCVASMMSQLGNNFVDAATDVILSCQAVSAVSESVPHLLMRYEAEDPRGPLAVARMAEYLEVPLAPYAAAEIAARFEASEVKARIDRAAEAGTFGDPPRPYIVDPSTQWHFNHIGPGTSQKRERLSPEELARVAEDTTEFCGAFGY